MHESDTVAEVTAADGALRESATVLCAVFDAVLCAVLQCAVYVHVYTRKLIKEKLGWQGHKLAPKSFAVPLVDL